MNIIASIIFGIGAILVVFGVFHILTKNKKRLFFIGNGVIALALALLAFVPSSKARTSLTHPNPQLGASLSSSSSPSALPSSYSPSQSSPSPSSPSSSASPSTSSPSFSSIMPYLSIQKLGWDYANDSPAIWVQAKNNTNRKIKVLRVKAKFVNPSSNQVLGTDSEYLAGSPYGSGSGSLTPSQSSLPIEVYLLLTTNHTIFPYPVTATLSWSERNYGHWNPWKTVTIPGSPPPGPFTNGTTSILPTPAKNVLEFTPQNWSTNILHSVMSATGHQNHTSGSAFLGTITETPESNGNVSVTWSVPQRVTHSVSPSGSASNIPSASWPSGNPAVFTFSISFHGNTLSGTNKNARFLMFGL